jgi:hypothetical protein
VIDNWKTVVLRVQNESNNTFFESFHHAARKEKTEHTRLLVGSVTVKLEISKQILAKANDVL